MDNLEPDEQVIGFCTNIRDSTKKEYQENV